MFFNPVFVPSSFNLYASHGRKKHNKNDYKYPYIIHFCHFKIQIVRHRSKNFLQRRAQRANLSVMVEKSVAFVTFGCKVNQYDTQAIRENFLKGGFREADASPEVFVINTCTVTEAAYKEARQLVARIRRERPKAKVVVTGCAAISNSSDFRKLGAEIYVKHKTQGISYFKGHTRAFLKVEDGCDLNCSFCIIPKVRGAPSSKRIEDAVVEARQLIANGYKEIVLTGVHLGSYGKDIYSKSSLSRLCAQLLEINGLERLRLSSLEANELNDEIIKLMAASEKFCPHLHLPLQSGDDDILRAMRRRYNIRQFWDAVDKVRGRIDNPAVTTDVILGFPGESEGNFQNTMSLCEKIGFSRIHIFPYSPRSGTDAAMVKETVSVQEKRSRLNSLKKLSKKLTANYYSKFIGKEIQVLIEGQNGSFSGYSERYIKTNVESSETKIGDIVKVRVERVKDGYVEAEFVERH